MTITDNLKELAADLLHSGASIQEVADQLSLPLKDAAAIPSLKSPI